LKVAWGARIAATSFVIVQLAAKAEDSWQLAVGKEKASGNKAIGKEETEKRRTE
jgi:hypothetical protein